MRTCHGGQYKSKEWVHKGVVGGINRGSMVELGGLGARMALSQLPEYNSSSGFQIFLSSLFASVSWISSESVKKPLGSL